MKLFQFSVQFKNEEKYENKLLTISKGGLLAFTHFSSEPGVSGKVL